MSKKHFIVTFENDKAQTSETLVWARENFPNYNEQIKNEEVYFHLVDKHGFTLVSDDYKFICYNFTHSIIAENNAVFNVTDSKKNGANDFYIYFTIGNDEYNLTLINNSVTLIKNNQNISVKPELRKIIKNRLGLNEDIINRMTFRDINDEYNSHDYARNMYNYLTIPNFFI
jgi:hypothetical protein